MRQKPCPGNVDSSAFRYISGILRAGTTNVATYARFFKQRKEKEDVARLAAFLLCRDGTLFKASLFFKSKTGFISVLEN